MSYKKLESGKWQWYLITAGIVAAQGTGNYEQKDVAVAAFKRMCNNIIKFNALGFDVPELEKTTNYMT